MAGVGWAQAQNEKTLVVNPNADQSEISFKTLEAAVAAANGLTGDDPVTINVAGGTYDLKPGTEEIQGQAGWYLPITKSNLTIRGNSKEGVIIKSTEVKPNGSWSSQNLITIFGNKVTLENMTLICKKETNKVIEVVGKDVTLRNITCTPPDETNFAGSIYFNSLTDGKDIGNVSLENIALTQGRITFSGAVIGAVDMKNINIDYQNVSISGNGMTDMAAYHPIGAVKGKDDLTINANNIEVKLSGTNESSYSLSSETVENLPINTTLILTGTSYGSDDNIQSFGTITKPGIKIQAASELQPKVYGTFQLLAPGCEISGLEFHIKGGNHPVKNSIDVVAMSVIIKDNIFNMGGVASGSVGNGVNIWPYGDGEPSFVINGNTFKGFKATTSNPSSQNWSSTGLLITEEIELSRFGDPFTTNTKSKAVTLDAAVEKNLCTSNTFDNCYTNYAHSNWKGYPGGSTAENAAGGYPVRVFSYVSSNGSSLHTALNRSKDGAPVYISGELTIDKDEQRYIKKAVTLANINPTNKATIKGCMAIQTEGVTVKDINFEYERESPLFSAKNGISVFANKATLTGNTFTTTDDGTNGIVFYPKGSGAVAQEYTVTDNTFNLTGASSTGIIVRENFKSNSQIPGVDATASLSNGSALDQQIIASESKNTFGNMTGGYYVRVTGDYSVLDGTGNGPEDITQKHIYSYVNANQAAEAIFYTQNGGYILADATYAKVVEAANQLDPKAAVPAGITIKCSDAYLVTDANTADKISEAGAQIYILTKEGNEYKATLNATTPTVDTADLKATTIEAGQSLSASILTGGSAEVGGKKISGVFTWNEPSIIAKKGDQTYTVLFTPNDQINYKKVEIPYTIKGIKQYHIITPGKCANGKVVIEGANSANKYEEGSTLSLKAVADANYKFKKWNDGITASYSVTKDAILTAEFEPIMHKVTIQKEGDGSIAINGKTDHNGSVSVQQGSELNVQAIPNNDKVLESLTCTNGKVISNGIVSVDQAFTISAKFVNKPADKFTVKVQTTENGKILLFDTNGNAITAGSSLAKGTEVSILPVANEGYKLKAQSLKNGEVEITNGKITLSADADIKAEFERQKFAVTTSVANGRIQLAGANANQPVDYDTQVTATASPDNGFKLLALLVNGKEIPNGGSFIVTAATEVKAVMRELATITIDETPQTFVYDGNVKAFVVKTIPAGIGGFNVSYNGEKPTNAEKNTSKAYDVTIERAADDTYAAFKKTIKDGLIIQAAEWKGISVPTANGGSIVNANIEGVGSFEWDGDVNNDAIHNAIFTPNNGNYAKSTFSIPTGKGNLEEISFDWGETTRSALKSSDNNLAINKKGADGSIIIMNGSAQLTKGNLYVGQKIRLKAIPGANASAKVTWKVSGESLDKTGDEVILTLKEGENTVTATFEEKAEPAFPGMENIEDRIYNGSIYGEGKTPTVKKGGVSNDWLITFKQNGVIIPSPTNAGTYEILASRSEDANYKSVTNKNAGTLTILPKEAVAEVKSVTPVLKGQALAQSVITGTADVDGTFLWDNPENVLTATSDNQAISFVPSNSNYKAKSGLKSKVVVTEATGVTLRTLNLNITNKDKGSVSMSLNGTEVQAGATVTKDDKLTVAFKANTGYTASATINSTTYTSGSTYTIPETGNIEVVVTFTKNSTPDTDPDEPSSQPIAVTGVSLDTTDKTLAVNETLILGATVKPANADNKDVRWSSSDATVASVDQDGKVKALKVGTCTITVTTDDGNFTATCKITVTTATGIDDILAANRVYSQNGQIVIEPMYQPEVWITDLNGRTMYHDRIAEKTQIAASAGIYLVRLSESGKAKTIKVIVK